MPTVFENVKKGQEFKYKNITYVKIDKDTGTRLENGKQKVHFFKSKDLIEV